MKRAKAIQAWRDMLLGLEERGFFINIDKTDIEEMTAWDVIQWMKVLPTLFRIGGHKCGAIVNAKVMLQNTVKAQAPVCVWGAML